MHCPWYIIHTVWWLIWTTLNFQQQAWRLQAYRLTALLGPGQQHTLRPNKPKNMLDVELGAIFQPWRRAMSGHFWVKEKSYCTRMGAPPTCVVVDPISPPRAILTFPPLLNSWTGLLPVVRGTSLTVRFFLLTCGWKCLRRLPALFLGGGGPSCWPEMLSPDSAKTDTSSWGKDPWFTQDFNSAIEVLVRTLETELALLGRCFHLYLWETPPCRHSEWIQEGKPEGRGWTLGPKSSSAGASWGNRKVGNTQFEGSQAGPRACCEKRLRRHHLDLSNWLKRLCFNRARCNLWVLHFRAYNALTKVLAPQVTLFTFLALLVFILSSYDKPARNHGGDHQTTVPEKTDQTQNRTAPPVPSAESFPGHTSRLAATKASCSAAAASWGSSIRLCTLSRGYEWTWRRRRTRMRWHRGRYPHTLCRQGGRWTLLRQQAQQRRTRPKNPTKYAPKWDMDLCRLQKTGKQKQGQVTSTQHPPDILFSSCSLKDWAHFTEFFFFNFFFFVMRSSFFFFFFVICSCFFIFFLFHCNTAWLRPR